MLVSAPIFAAGSQLTNIRVSKMDAATRIIFSFTDPVQQHVFNLENPRRLVIDVNNTRLVEHLKNLDFPTKEVKSIRYGYPKPRTLRLVLDLGSVSQYRVVTSASGKQFTVDISSGALPEKSVTAPIITEPTPPPAVIPKAQAVPQAYLNKEFIVVIDAGHGGKDPGAMGTHGTNEKNVVLAIAKKLAQLVNQQPNMHAVLTRNGDYFVQLRDRLKLARKGKADIFISIHADSYFEKGATGVSVYALSHRGATSVAAKWIAQRENYSELGGVDLGELKDQSYLLRSVLVDLAQTATITDSLRLGTSVLDSLDSIASLHYTHVEQAPFMVLKSPDIPSILVETGFITNSKEEARLQGSAYQNKLAQALLDGIRAYRKKYITG